MDQKRMGLSQQTKKSINHSRFFILLTFFLTILKIPNGFCQTILSLSNGAELSYRNGQFDLSNYTGEMSDVIYYQPNGEFITAENVIIRSNEDTLYENAIYNLVEIKRSKLDSQKEQFSLSAELIKLQDLPYSLVVHLLKSAKLSYNGKNFSDSSDAELVLLSPNLQLLGVDFERKGISIKTEEIKASIIRKENIFSNNLPLTNFKLSLEDTKVQPDEKSKIASNFASFLSDAELNALSLSLVTESQFFQDNNIQHIKLSIQLISSQLIRMKINLHVSFVALESLPKIIDPNLLKSVLPHTKLHMIELELKDLGLHSRLSDSRSIRYHNATDNFYNALIKSMPKNGESLANPLKLFTYSGGTLKLKSRPSSPKPIAMIASMLLFPELLVEEFAISSSHYQ